MASSDFIDEGRGLSAFRSLGLIPALLIVTLAGSAGRYLASSTASESASSDLSGAVAVEDLPPASDETETRSKTLYEQAQEDGSSFDTLKQSVSLESLIKQVSLASLEEDRPKLEQRPIPFFDVDAACGAYPNVARHQCVAHEQKSYDAAMAAWRHLTPGTIQGCTHQARHAPAQRRYGALEQCIRVDLAREESRRKAFEPAPKFQYRGKFIAF